MDSNASGGISSWLLLTLVALTSAILCIAQPSFGGWFEVLYVGAVYGALLVVYFAMYRGIRSAPKLMAIVVVSAVSWPIAYFGSFSASSYIPGGTVNNGGAIDPAFPLIAFGGMLGGVCLLMPVLLLLKPPSTGWRTAFAKVLLGIVLSGIVGGIAWELGPSLGAAIWELLPAGSYPQSESYNMAALFFVWQPVIALSIGWATLEKRQSASMAAVESPLPLSSTPDWSGGPHSRQKFIAVLAVLFTLSLTRIIPVRIRLAHRENAVARMRNSKPALAGFPELPPMPEENALILSEISDYRPGHVVKTVEMASREKGFERSGDMYFETLYTRTGEPVPTLPQAPRRYISVTVRRYPSSEWAQYLAEYPPNIANLFRRPPVPCARDAIS